jgi:hypothetical protein
MPATFRETPPLDLLENLLLGFGLKSINDCNWFCKSQINLPHIESVLPELEPYYIPCKSKEFILCSMTHQKTITILRQVLNEHNIELKSIERSRNSVKTIWYQLVRSNHLSSSVSIDFS